MIHQLERTEKRIKKKQFLKIYLTFAEETERVAFRLIINDIIVVTVGFEWPRHQPRNSRGTVSTRLGRGDLNMEFQALYRMGPSTLQYRSPLSS